MSVDDFHRQFVDRGEPVLLYGRGAVSGSAWHKWTRSGLLAAYGERRVNAVPSHVIVSDQRRGKTSLGTSLAEYLEDATGRPADPADDDPPYVFGRAARFAKNLTDDITVAPYFGDASRFSWSTATRRERALFFLGPAHSGAGFHAHYAAWNAVVYGRKRWLVMPPQAPIGAPPTNGEGQNQTVLALLEWLTRQNLNYAFRPLDCVQEAGTLLFIPEGWSHATINLEDTVGLSMELGPSALTSG